jgi:hypothetical protein
LDHPATQNTPTVIALLASVGQKLFEFSSHEEHVMTIRFLKDAPFKGSHGVYFAIKLAVLVLAVLLALHFFGVV